MWESPRPSIKPQFAPRSHNDVYPFIHPNKFRGALLDKVTINTGSAGAIGQALAESFAVAGAKLVLTYNNTLPPTTLKERCLNLGASDVIFTKCNVAELKGCEDLLKQASVTFRDPVQFDLILEKHVEGWGQRTTLLLLSQTLEAHGKIDILTNNAGANSLGLFDTQPPKAFIHELAVNLHGPYYLMHLLLPHFKSQRSGCVLNIASRAGTVTIPYSTGYCTSKARRR